MQPFALANHAIVLGSAIDEDSAANDATNHPEILKTIACSVHLTRQSPLKRRGRNHVASMLYKPLSAYSNFASVKQHLKTSVPTFVERGIGLATPIKIPPN
ncbi:hypothetical protein [Bradyrhizobium sp. RT3b]|uniref:hypothetical protein n=1 Tax=Bradyrhizobium sp. RT3b TaxID=3156334 RepID=UPI00339241EC